ncbi:MAG: hypothetical protein O2955_00930 [Planctomycetota bacterium]|nr:hypothetical protein [Planctomycetota bacterium]
MSAVRRAWSDLSVIALPEEGSDSLNGQSLVVLPGYDIVLTVGIDATQRCAADWQATQICYLVDDPTSSSERRGSIREQKAKDRSAVESEKTEPSELAGPLRLFREKFEQPIRWDRFDPMTYHIAASTEIWNRLPARSIRRVDQILPPPIDTDFFQPSHHTRDEVFFCIYDESLDGTATIVEACDLALRKVVVATYGSADLVPDSIADRKHVDVCEIHSADDLRHQFWQRRALLMTKSGWSQAVLEAQACGMPVILADGKSHADDPETHHLDESLLIDMEETDPGSGLCSDEHSVESIYSAIRELERRPQRFSSSLAWAHAARHSPPCFGRSLKHLAEQARHDDLQSSSFVRQHWKRAG